MSIFKKIASSFGILFLLLILGLAIYGYKNEALIADQLIEEVQKNMQTELDIESYSISLFKNFPSASATLKNVRLEGKNGKPFINAGNIEFKLGLYSLLRAKTSIHQVTLKDATVHILDHGRKDRNYEVFIKKKDKAKGNFSLNFNKTILENVNLIFENKKSNHKHELQIENGFVKGNVNEDYLNLDIEINTLSKYLDVSETVFAKNVPLDIVGNLEVHLEEGAYAFNDLSIDLNDNLIHLNGSIQNKEGHDYYQLDFDCNNGNIASLIKSMPKSIRDDFSIYSPSGQITLKGKVYGRSSKKENPKIDISYKATQWSLNYAK
ncbi:MAG: AsmA family protein, partial [Bacteroidota bacterium]